MGSGPPSRRATPRRSLQPSSVLHRARRSEARLRAPGPPLHGTVLWQTPQIPPVIAMSLALSEPKMTPAEMKPLAIHSTLGVSHDQIDLCSFRPDPRLSCERRSPPRS